MTRGQLLRVSGLALLVGAIIFIIHVVLRSAITAGPDPATFAKESLWVPINVIGVVGAVLILLGLPSLYLRMVGSAGTLGMLGLTLLVIAWIFFGLFLSLYGVLVLPWLADKAPSLVTASSPLPTAFVVAFGAGLLAWFVGAVLVGIPFARRRAQPSWIGYVLVASGILVVIGNLIIAPSGPASNLAINLLSNMGPVLLLIAIGYLGYRMWSDRYV